MCGTLGVSLDLGRLVRQVAYNCEVADARHAGDASLCIYLMRMRERYRARHGLDFPDEPDRAALGAWIREREAHWDTLEDADYRALDVDGQSLDPFDASAVNGRLEAAGLVYSAGFGLGGAAQFFLGELEGRHEQDGASVRVAGREYAQDLSVTPALSQGSSIYLRREAIRRLVWEKTLEARWHPGQTPMRRALDATGFEHDAGQAVGTLAHAVGELLLRHELGEVAAGQVLGDARWAGLVQNTLGGGAEPWLRAARDNLADALKTLPFVLAQAQPVYLHLYFALLGPVRRTLQPALIAAYQTWLETGAREALGDAASASLAHWQSVTHAVLDGAHEPAALRGLIEARTL